MKYMTKDWYTALQKTHLYQPLEISEAADTFSQETFQKLYQIRENEYIYWQREAFSDLETAPAFDEDLLREQFRQDVLPRRVEEIKNELPPDILRHVADLRVLALRVCSATAYDAITAYCNENEQTCRSAAIAYNQYFEQEFPDGIPHFAHDLYLHDNRIASCETTENDLILHFDDTNELNRFQQIILKNFRVIKQDTALENAVCLYEEIYRDGNRYEIHFLLWQDEPDESESDDTLSDFIVSVSDLEYRKFPSQPL